MTTISAPPARGGELLARVRETVRLRHYSPRTERAYVQWIRRFIRFHGTRHPALLFLYRRVLRAPLPWLQNVVRAKRAERLPVVLTRDEVRAVIGAMDGAPRLVALLLYGGGLRLMEAVQLRVQDLDAARGEVLVRAGKGGKDRRTILPQSVIAPLRDHLRLVRGIHQQDLADPRGVHIVLPDAIARKYPSAPREWLWRWVFPAGRLFADGRGRVWRHHLHPSRIQRAVHEAVRRVGLEKRASSHSLRHSFATHLLEDGYDIRTVQDFWGTVTWPPP